MGIFEECLEAYPSAVPGAKVDSIIASLSKEDAESLRQALSNKDISSSRIADVLARRGHKIGRDAIRGWRKREGITL